MTRITRRKRPLYSEMKHEYRHFDKVLMLKEYADSLTMSPGEDEYHRCKFSPKDDLVLGRCQHVRRNGEITEIDDLRFPQTRMIFDAILPLLEHNDDEFWPKKIKWWSSAKIYGGSNYGFVNERR